MSDRYTYTINDANEVSLFDAETPNEDGKPSVFQYFDPNTKAPFASAERAKQWAEEQIADLLTPPIVVIPEAEEESAEDAIISEEVAAE